MSTSLPLNTAKSRTTFNAVNDNPVLNTANVKLMNILGASMSSVGMMEGDMLNLRLNEKELLNGLNSRMAAYIEKGWSNNSRLKYSDRKIAGP